MSQILLLTKNILSNQVLQEKFQQLNYEVWCSARLVEQVQQFSTPPTVIQQFQTVVFSKTISDSEVEGLLEFFSRYSIAILRETETLPSPEEQTKWLELGMHDWLLETDNLIDLREKLSQTKITVMKNMESSKRVVSFSKVNVKKDIDPSQVQLTGRERKLLDVLIKAEGNLITRTELCEKIWSDGKTSSNMSQLSCMVNRIKRKFKDHGIEENIILTQWGKGYQLSESFYQQYAERKQQVYQ
ncbi:helix-turn-helix domain-containing protein [Enterococcus sp. AZ109]|uniref:helix-turn-helix domain-containing protein n=1 Tax=Enterococcus sp. AZ109 TaxID=2774634 RepID=UPI003F27F205